MPAPESARLTAGEYEECRRRIERLERDCGCGFGAATSLLFLALYLLLLSFGRFESLSSVPARVLVGLAVFILGGGIGKVAGFRIGRRRLRRAQIELRERLLEIEGDILPAERPQDRGREPLPQAREDEAGGLRHCSPAAVLPLSPDRR